MSRLVNYLDNTPKESWDIGTIHFLSGNEIVEKTLPDIAKWTRDELESQRSSLKLIASENYSSLAVQAAMGNLLTDKYAEGVPYNRFYAGCENVDKIENEARSLACKLFGAEHAYVQPHSGADANMVAFLTILSEKVQNPLLKEFNSSAIDVNYEQFQKIREKYGKQKLMALDLYSGGHLTHGYRLNFSSILFDSHPYSVDKETGLLDIDKIYKQAKEVKPLILLAGYSAYPRHIDFQKMREIADSVGAVLMVDMAHFAGLVAGRAFAGVNNPIPYAHIVTSTTHKTLRGPRGGLVLCKKEYIEALDKGCPTFLGGPLPHVMAAKAIAFREALTPEYRDYASNIIKNSKKLADCFIEKGIPVATNGTDNHLILINVYQKYGLTGRQAETALRESGITMNRNSLPNDINGPWYTSGLRLGTPALTTLGMKENEMIEIADIIDNILKNTSPANSKKGISKAKFIINQDIKEESKSRVKNLLNKFPLYKNIPNI